MGKHEDILSDIALDKPPSPLRKYKVTVPAWRGVCHKCGTLIAQAKYIYFVGQLEQHTEQCEAL